MGKDINTIIVLRSGLLGDSLVAIPALWCLRKAYPNARITYIREKLPGADLVKGYTVLEGSGLVDEFEYYQTHLPMFKEMGSIAKLFWRLSKRQWDLGIVLEESHWPVRRKYFLRICGAKIVLGPDGSGVRFPRDSNKRLIPVPHIADTLIDILRALDISLPEKGKGSWNINLGQSERTNVDNWLKKVGAINAPKPWIAVGPWSNMPVKRWPLERFAKVVTDLIREFNVTPFIFGGVNERSIGRHLIDIWGRGYVTSGELSIREGVELLKSCAIFLGNDTGTMHMAATAGIKCVAIFSSHGSPGRWEPYGNGHAVFRKSISCEGCALRECVENKMQCILSFGIEEVTNACRKILLQRMRK